MARILVADADLHNCEMIGIALEPSGHHVLRVGTGAAAIELIQEDAADLVLCDIMLPMRSGFDILAAVDGLGLRAGLPVVFLTTSAREQDMARAIAAGAADYVLKPFHPGELATRIALALARSSARRASLRPVPPRPANDWERAA